MSIRDAARIAALEARVSELVSRLERLEQATAVRDSKASERNASAARPRQGRH
jgi:hypothetical protein